MTSCWANCEWHHVGAPNIFNADIYGAVHFGCYTWAYPEFRMSRSYTCNDGYNHYVPKGEYVGVSATAPTGTKSVETIVKYKYKASVSANDECKVTECVIHVDFQSQRYSCAQNVGSGSYQNTQREFNLLPGRHSTYIQVGAYSLPKQNIF